MLVLKIACLKLCFINLTRSECNCKTPLSTELTHGIPTIISFLCTSIISVLSALLLNKFPLKIVQAFASFTLWLSVITSPDYLVVKCKIIFQKCSVPQNVQCSMLFAAASLRCKHCACTEGWIWSSDWCLLKFVHLCHIHHCPDIHVSDATQRQEGKSTLYNWPQNLRHWQRWN